MRFWRFALNTDDLYEAIRTSTDTAAGLSGTTCIQPAASAPKDSKSRIMLAVDANTLGYSLVLMQLISLQLQGKVTEISQGDYIAGLEPAPSTGGGGGGGTAVTYARRFAWNSGSGYSYIGTAVAGSATSAPVWTIKRSTVTTAGAITSTATATNVAWDNYATATYN